MGINIAVQLDTRNMDAGIVGIEKCLTGLEKMVSSATNVMAKAFLQVEDVLSDVRISIEETRSMLTSSIGTEQITPVVEERWYDGIVSFANGMEQAFNAVNSKVGEVEILSGKVKPYLEAIGAAFDKEGNFLTKLFPKTGEIVSIVGEMTGKISGLFKSLDIGISLASVGWGAAIGVAIAAIIALVTLIVQNWDEIKAALGAAAEWFNTNIIQPIVGFFTGLWTSITTIVNNIWNGIVSICSGIAQWVQNNVIQPVLNFFAPIVDWFSQLFFSIGQTVSDVFHNIVVLIKGYLELVFTIWKTIGIWFYENVIKPMAQFCADLWNGICSIAADAWNGVKSVFWTVVAWFDTTIIQPAAELFARLWDGFTQKASNAWEAVKGVFSAVTGFFKDIFSEAWEGVVKVFRSAGDIFTNIKDGILDVFKKIVNGLIDGINAVVAVPFNGINGALEIVKNINILGLTPFAELRMISVPEIPHLAYGAVLPANKPFLAVVGDQKHGTNVEAPLATIQEAVALVMEDQFAGMMAGFEASVGVQKQILQAILGIEIGDTTIGQAAARYNHKMAIIRGGM